MSVIQNLCVVDQLQSFGPEFELLVFSNAYPLSNTEINHSSSIEQSDWLSEQSVGSASLSSPVPLLSLHVSILTPFSPKHPDHKKQNSSHVTSGLQLVTAKCSGLDVLGVCVCVCVCVCVIMDRMFQLPLHFQKTAGFERGNSVTIIIYQH